MMLRSTAIVFIVTIASIPTWTATASALSLQECSAKYKAAKSAGTTMKWNEFRKAECSDAAATPAAGPAPTTAAAPKATKNDRASTASTPPSAAAGRAVFPSAVSPKYSKESEGKARMHTCLDQYNANKADNGNGGMKWIEKGGGYYSECNKRLKG